MEVVFKQVKQAPGYALGAEFCQEPGVPHSIKGAGDVERHYECVSAFVEGVLSFLR